MTTVHGNEGYVSVGGNELKVKSFQLTETSPVTDDTDIGDDWEKKMTGAPKSWTATLTCSLKRGSAAQNALVAGAEVAVGLYPGGNGSGQTYRSGNAIVETIDNSQDFSNASSVTFTVVGNGALASDTV